MIGADVRPDWSPHVNKPRASSPAGLHRPMPPQPPCGAPRGPAQRYGILVRGWSFADTGKALEAVQTITSGISTLQLTGAAVWMPVSFAHLTKAYAELGQSDDDWRCIAEAMATMKTTRESWWEAEVHRMAGEVALQSPKPDAPKAEACFERALAVARKQQATSLELRASMSMARLWRDQGKRDEARDILAPVYGWFTEGFDTRDLKEAKALLDALAAA